MALPLISKLVAHWLLNDNDIDTTVSDTKGVHNGTWQHGSTNTDSVSGKINLALNFDGTNDYVVVPSSEEFNQSTFSYCVWLKHSVNSIMWDRILSKKVNYYDGTGYEITLDGANTDVLYVSGSSSDFATTPLEINWLDNQWNHLAVVFQGTNIKVYCNGSLKTTTGNIVPVMSNSETLRLGKIISEATTMWDGAMDDARYYSIALTQEQINSIYNSGSGTETDGSVIRPFISFLPGQPADG